MNFIIEVGILGPVLSIVAFSILVFIILKINSSTAYNNLIAKSALIEIAFIMVSAIVSSAILVFILYFSSKL